MYSLCLLPSTCFLYSSVGVIATRHTQDQTLKLFSEKTTLDSEILQQVMPYVRLLVLFQIVFSESMHQYSQWEKKNQKFIIGYLSPLFLLKIDKIKKLKVSWFRNGLWGHRFPPKNERNNSFLLVCELFSFVFWRKSTTSKNISKLTDL